VNWGLGEAWEEVWPEGWSPDREEAGGAEPLRGILSLEECVCGETTQNGVRQSVVPTAWMSTQDNPHGDPARTSELFLLPSPQ
jgi:hypothetical protein